MAKINFLFNYLWHHKKLTIFFIIIILIAGYFAKRQFFPSTNSYETSEVKKGTVKEELILSGTVTADEYAQLAFPTSGTLEWINVKAGDEVAKGQALAKLDTVSLNAVYQQAQNSLRATEANLLEVHDSVKDHSGDETFAQKNDRTAAEVAKDNAYEAVIAAQKNLKNATLTAPFAGIISSVTNPFAGVNVLATQTQIEIVNPDTIYFAVSADQTEITDIHLNDKVAITLDALEDKELTGTVNYVSYTPLAGEVGSVYLVKVTFDNLDEDVLTYRIGMTGDASFTQAQKDAVFYVPSAFINNDDKGDYILTEKGKKKLYITVGLEGEEYTEISGENIVESLVVYD